MMGSSARKPQMDWNPQFMIDKNTENAVGEIFLGSPTWQIMQRGLIG